VATAAADRERVGTAAADRERGGASDGGGLFRAALGAAGPQLVWGDQGGGGTLETREEGERRNREGRRAGSGLGGAPCERKRCFFFPFYTMNIYPSL
jgi:hypothetical protein